MGLRSLLHGACGEQYYFVDQPLIFVFSNLLQICVFMRYIYVDGQPVALFYFKKKKRIGAGFVDYVCVVG